MIDRDALLAWDFPEITHRYTREDTMAYALAIGLGGDPCDPAALRFVADTRIGTPLALPTMAVVIGFPGSWMRDPATGIDFARIVHGEEALILHRPLPAEGDMIARHKVVDVTDKGTGRGAIVVYDKDLYLADGVTHVATVRHTTFARGDGGFSGRPALARAAGPHSVGRTAEKVLELRGLPQQALLYRLCADRNPLHADPDIARAAGFERPILHGLCTFGMAGYALLHDWCGGDPAMLASMRARFASPVYPGETLVVESFRDGADIGFRARVKERDMVVLTDGRASLRKEEAA